MQPALYRASHTGNFYNVVIYNPNFAIILSCLALHCLYFLGGRVSRFSFQDFVIPFLFSTRGILMYKLNSDLFL